MYVLLGSVQLFQLPTSNVVVVAVVAALRYIHNNSSSLSVSSSCSSKSISLSPLVVVVGVIFDLFVALCMAAVFAAAN